MPNRVKIKGYSEVCELLNKVAFYILVWVFLFWSLRVILRFQMVGRAGNSSDKAASRQRLPTVRSTLFKVLIDCPYRLYSDDVCF